MCGLSSCWKKNKQLLLRNDVVVPSTKHTEDDHICEPITEEGTLQIFLCISMPNLRKCYLVMHCAKTRQNARITRCLEPRPEVFHGLHFGE